MAESKAIPATPSVPQPDRERQRSPAYPSIALDEAIENVKRIYEADHGAAGTMDVVASHLESSPKSSGFLQAIASMVRYGLLDDLEGKPRRLKVSKLAMDILLLPHDNPKWKEAIRICALSPAAFVALWNEHGTTLPSDQNLLHHLVTVKHFRPDTAADLISQYKKTMAFAKDAIGDKIDEPGRAELGQKWDKDNRVDSFGWMERQFFPRPIDRTKELDTKNRMQVSTPEVPPSATAIKQDAFISETGDIVVRWPAMLAAADREDLAVWLDRIKRRIMESVKSTPDPRANPNLKMDGPAKIEMDPQ